MWCQIFVLALIFDISDSRLFTSVHANVCTQNRKICLCFSIIFHHVTFFYFFGVSLFVVEYISSLTVLHLSRIRSFQFFFISVLFHSFKYFFDYDNAFTFYSKTSSSLPLSSSSSITLPCHSLITF